MRAAIWITLFVLLTSAASADIATKQDEQWLCLADMATGFRWNGQRWEQSNFYTDKKRYVISRNKERGNALTAKSMKDATEVACTEPNEYGFLFCNDWGEFKMNVKALRYMSTYPFGFIDGRDEDGNTPSIEIGTCSRF